MNSEITQGFVRHRRYTGCTHVFKYDLFMMLLDLSELDSVFKRFWLWSVGRWNIASFKRENYLKGEKGDLLAAAKRLIYNATGNKIEKVFLLTHMSYLGYCFNPISIYFCFTQGRLVNCIAEVTNTPWGESHRYILNPDCIRPNVYAMQFQKMLHVSPFLTADYKYDMRCKYDLNRIIIHIKNMRNGSCDFDATLTLKRLPINHVNLRLALLKFPWMTGKVIVAIYWQGLKLWLKGLKVVQHSAKKT